MTSVRAPLLLPPSNRALRHYAVSVGVIALLGSLVCVTGAPAAAVLGQAGRASATQSLASDGWAPFQSHRGHFSVDRPTRWTAEERVDAEGALVTTFTPPSGAAISVVVRSGTPANADNSDLVNIHCRAVTVGSHSARSCLDTISSSLVTTVADQARTYIITGSRKRGDQRIYDRLVSSFRILP